MGGAKEGTYPADHTPVVCGSLQILRDHPNLLVSHELFQAWHLLASLFVKLRHLTEVKYPAQWHSNWGMINSGRAGESNHWQTQSFVSCGWHPHTRIWFIGFSFSRLHLKLPEPHHTLLFSPELTAFRKVLSAPPLWPKTDFESWMKAAFWCYLWGLEQVTQALKFLSVCKRKETAICLSAGRITWRNSWNLAQSSGHQ